MKSLLMAAVMMGGFSASGTQPVEASGYKSYAYQYCHYYKARALGAQDVNRKDYLWAKYRACLREYGAY